MFSMTLEDNPKTTGTAIRGTVVVVHEEPPPADDFAGTLVWRSQKKAADSGEIATDTRHRRLRTTDIAFYFVARRLHGGVCCMHDDPVMVPLTPAHRRSRSLWCAGWTPNWRDNEWGRVLFTDESRFSHGGRAILMHTPIWKRVGKSRNHPSNIIERDRRRYGSAVPFMDDNAPCHRTVAAEQLLESEDIERMDWPADLRISIPSSMYGFSAGRRLPARTVPPVTIRES
ncbi:hypothetical protein TNCV_1157461 [Trichonephila clavipes]|nr:hypothetical protein TNCV_1157461 [Trichonephila clavipes]